MTPVGHKSSKGGVKRATRARQGQVRALKDLTERKCEVEFGLDTAALLWPVGYAGWTLREARAA